MRPVFALKIKSIVQLFEILPLNERIIVDILRQIIVENLPMGIKEKIAFNVPFYYGKRGICIIWPAAVPRGGLDEGVLLGFWQGNKLNDTEGYLTHGTNKKVYYRIYKTPEEIDEKAIVRLLLEAIRIDNLAVKIKIKALKSC